MTKPQTKWSNDYKAKYLKRINLELKIEDYEIFKRIADEEGIPVSTLIKQLMFEYIRGK